MHSPHTTILLFLLLLMSSGCGSYGLEHHETKHQSLLNQPEDPGDHMTSTSGSFGGSSEAQRKCLNSCALKAQSAQQICKSQGQTSPFSRCMQKMKSDYTLCLSKCQDL